MRLSEQYQIDQVYPSDTYFEFLSFLYHLQVNCTLVSNRQFKACMILSDHQVIFLLNLLLNLKDWLMSLDEWFKTFGLEVRHLEFDTKFAHFKCFWLVVAQVSFSLISILVLKTQVLIYALLLFTLSDNYDQFSFF